MAKTYTGLSGAWREVSAIHVGRNGSWAPQKLRLIGKDGKWVEAYSGENIVSKEIVDVTALKYRAGGALQGDLLITGTGKMPASQPAPASGAFYRFRTNAADAFENFAGVVPHGAVVPSITTVDGDGAFALNSANAQYLTAPVSTDNADAYYDLLGLMGNDGVSSDARGKKHWEIGFKFKLSALPASGQKTYLAFSGDETKNIAVYVDHSGKLTARFRNDVYEKLIELPSVIAAGAWHGCVFRHRPDGDDRYLELIHHTGASASILGDITRTVGATTYREFTYWVPAADAPVTLGSAKIPGSTVIAEKFFMPDTTSPALTISTDGNTLNGVATAFRNAVPSDYMAPGTGSYYIEIQIHDSYDVHIGVTDATFQPNTAPGVVGWCINTFAGRKFTKQTGSGTAWTSAIAANSTVGMVYNSNTGAIEIYVNGVKRANPFADGTITVPVRFIIGGRAGTATTNLFNVTTVRGGLTGTWAYFPNGSNTPNVPNSRIVGSVSTVYADATYRDFFLRNAAMSGPARSLLAIDPNPSVDVIFTNLATSAETVVNEYILRRVDDAVTINVPELAEGNYTVGLKYRNVETSNQKLFTIKNQSVRSSAMGIDFTQPLTKRFVDSQLMAAHKQWGGANGGVNASNVEFTPGSPLTIRARGDNYVGPIKGVDRLGAPSGFDTRIGGAVVSRDYFGPGRYRVKFSMPQSLKGACTAMWSFHYEEGYLGSPLYDAHVSDGIHPQEPLPGEFYTARNHEIDIEFPSALKTTPDQENVSYLNGRFNTWLGESRNYNVPNPDVPTSDPMYSPTPDPAYWSEFTDHFINHGIDLSDGAEHEIGYDWHLGADPRVVFYVDGVVVGTNRTHVPNIPGRLWFGIWFPSGSTQWAGRGAPWDTMTVFVKEISVTPYADELEFMNNAVETYPTDGFRDIP